MKWLKQLGVAGLLLVPALAFAMPTYQVTVTTRCVGSHFLRVNGTEMRFTILELDNADLVNPVTIQRVTVRDWDGTVLKDYGPEGIDGPIPPNTGFSPTQYVTDVPPGAIFGISTTDTWGLNAIDPTALSNARTGTFLSLTVKATKAGNPLLFRVHSREITRDRIVNPNTGGISLGAERSANDPECNLVF